MKFHGEDDDYDKTSMNNNNNNNYAILEGGFFKMLRTSSNSWTHYSGRDLWQLLSFRVYNVFSFPFRFPSFNHRDQLNRQQSHLPAPFFSEISAGPWAESSKKANQSKMISAANLGKEAELWLKKTDSPWILARKLKNSQLKKKKTFRKCSNQKTSLFVSMKKFHIYRGDFWKLE